VTVARHAAWVLLLVPACFHPNYDHPACGPNRECPDGLTCNEQSICDRSSPDDAAIDADPPILDGAPLDGKVQPVCKGVYVNICVDPPQSAVTLTTQTINTTNSALCAAYVSTPSILDACVIAGQSITIPSNNTVKVVGNRRLILFSTGLITIAGTLDAASHRSPTTNGPAADSGPCPTNVTNPTAGGQGDGGGGWGGSFGGAGNNGGRGAESGIGGIAAAAITATTLRGGCPGSKGAGGGAGNGGHGGGAVALIAAQTLMIPGIVNASGSGGSGALNDSGGGGGGGSGGMIVLDAATVDVSGQCFANGGGAGEGANVAANGNPGNESSVPSTPGRGGANGSQFGGDGGDGSFGTALGGKPGNSGSKGGGALGGGGGGGGGAGIIKVFSTSQSGTNDPTKVSPPPS